MPDCLTAAVHITMNEGTLGSLEFLMGGPDLDINFKLSAFMGREGKKVGGPDTNIKVKQSIADLRFRRNTHVTDWELLHER